MASELKERTDFFALCLLGTLTPFDIEGETLSKIMSLIHPGERLRPDTPGTEHICSEHATIIDGPDGLGLKVDNKIQLGLLRVLEAIVAGKTHISIIGHSRGACQAIVLTNYLEDIKNSPCDSDLISILQPSSQAGAVIKFLGKSYHGEIGAYFDKNAATIKQNIAHVQISLFCLDPVPGGALRGYTALSWQSDKFLTVPPIVSNYYQIVFTHELSDCFQALLPTISDATKENVMPLPGYHGSGSSCGGFQGGKLDPIKQPQLVKISAVVQGLAFGHILQALKSNNVVFQEHILSDPAQQWLEPHLQKIATTVLMEAPQWHGHQLCLYNILHKNQAVFDYYNTQSYGLGRNAPSFIYHEGSFSKRKVLVGNTYFSIDEALSSDCGQKQGFVNLSHKQIWLKITFGNFLRQASEPIEGLKRLIDYIIRRSELSRRLKEDAEEFVGVLEVGLIRFQENEREIVLTILHAAIEMYSQNLFNTSNPQFVEQIQRMVNHYRAHPDICNEIKVAIESALRDEPRNLEMGQLMTRVQSMQELSKTFPTAINPDIQLRVLADVVFYRPPQNPNIGFYFTPKFKGIDDNILLLLLDAALLSPIVSPRMLLLEDRRDSQSPLLEPEVKHSINYLLLSAELASLLTIGGAYVYAACAVKTAIAIFLLNPVGIAIFATISAIIITHLAITEYQTYLAPQQAHNPQARLNLFSPPPSCNQSSESTNPVLLNN